jgi:serine/threonine-protein kinase
MTTDTSEHWTIVMPDARVPRGASAVAPQVGSQLGKYRLCLELASGGMSTVFLARVQDGVGRHRFVALKCLKPRLAEEPTYAAMFLDEARISSLIHHPHVCDVIDFRVQGGISYMAMELLEGQTLAALLGRMGELGEAWPPVRIAGVIARIVADAAEGLHHAHELTDLRGEPLRVVHRDVSPENVFLTYDGVVKIMDFGVAMTSQQSHHTEPGTFKGKYSYVAPEVLRGSKPDRRVDVWGLGMLLWELLAGRRLFAVDNEIDMLRAVIEMEIPRPSQLRPGIPPALDDIVLRALERDPARRFPTARELARKLTCLLAEEHIACGLPELSDFVAAMYPSGRTSAQQMRYTVERMDAAAPPDDGNERPTVSSPLSAPTAAIPASALSLSPSPSPLPAPTPTPTGMRAAPARGTPTGYLVRARRRSALRDRRLWAVISPLVAAAAVIGVLIYQGRARAPDPAPAAPPDARALQAHSRPAALPICTPGPVEPTATASAGDARLVELEPVTLPTGEVVFRVKPVARDATESAAQLAEPGTQ